MTEHGQDTDDETNRWSKAFEASYNKELANFQRLLPELLKTDQGVFVAISSGKIIDKDRDESKLADRIAETHSDKFVLVHKVTQKRPEVPKPSDIGR